LKQLGIQNTSATAPIRSRRRICLAVHLKSAAGRIYSVIPDRRHEPCGGSEQANNMGSS
jgi:hypothetical protein